MIRQGKARIEGVERHNNTAEERLTPGSQILKRRNVCLHCSNVLLGSKDLTQVQPLEFLSIQKYAANNFQGHET